MPTTAPYGTWESPISAPIACSSGIRFADQIRVDGDALYWVESRPQESGRSVIVKRGADGAARDVGPADFDARTRVHEYGGAAYTVHAGVVYAADFSDQRWYRIENTVATPITPEPLSPAGVRYADLAVSGSWAIAVRETHHDDGSEPVNDLVRIDLTGTDEPIRVTSGHDFFAAPRISPDGTRLAWITWDHPNMPWDGTDLWVADLSPTGDVGVPRHVAGGQAESVLQPEWSPNGVLHCASDRSGWWNLYRLTDDSPEPIHSDEAEYAHEPWVFGLTRYAFLSDGRIVAGVEGPEGDRLLVLGESLDEVEHPFSSVGGSMAVAGTHIYVIGSSFDRPSRLVDIDLTSGHIDTVRSPGDTGFAEGFAALPSHIQFETPDGPAYALYYPPTHPDFVGPENELPPLIVTIHGGPTARIGMAMNPERLFWTSRGFAVIDVDYGGSTGHGRAYRSRLDGEWGEVDVRDCALAAAHVAQAGLADRARLVIQGGSAGGYTVLMALARHDVFACGVASYPVTDLVGLATDTHKFESRYLDSIVGPYPEMRERYLDRSPTKHVGSITAPVLLLQGLEDRVVPPSQPRAMQAALLAEGVPVGYIEFEGEGHGFRSQTARVRALSAQLAFYGRVLGFEPADDLAGVDVPGL